MTTQIDIQTKIAVAVEVLNTEKTKAEISREFNVSTRSVGRWADQFKSEAEQVLMDQQNKSKEATEIKTHVEEYQKRIIENYYAKKNEDLKEQNRKGVRGRPAKGVKTIRQIVMETIEFYKDRGLLTKDNRKKIIEDIMEETGHDYKVSAKYFSAYKKLFGGYDE